jgi:hypothetical protein
MKLPLLLVLAAAAPLEAPLAQGCAPDPAADLQVAVTPTLALPGQTVQVALTNLSAGCTYSLPTSCVFASVHPDACDGDPVFTPGCFTALTPIPPGATVTMSWDQLDDLGQQVADGLYTFAVDVLGPTGATTSLCPVVQVGTSCTKPAHYGAGSPGTGGLTPAISSLGGYPQIGNGDFDVAVTNAVGGAVAVCVGSLAPASLDLGFGTVLVDPGPIALASLLALSGSPGVPGQGIGILDVPVPNQPGLVGAEVYFQWVVGDAASSGGLSLSEGLRVAICP